MMLSLGVGAFSPTPPCTNIPDNLFSQFSLFSFKSHHTNLSFCSSRVTHLGFCAVVGKIRGGSCAFALKSQRKGVNTLVDMEDLDLLDEDDGDDEDEEMIIPMRNMRKWLEDKPPGFGEGKEYDTSIEDKLAEEMEQSRFAQLANINNLKKNPEISNIKKEQLQKQKVSEVTTGIRVRLLNLPKKKNVHRDLQSAFKGVQGIINIVPVVSGNKKTREPMCKGIAFVYFKSENEANRFIQDFSRQSIPFGKIQKQINFEMMNSSSPKPAYENFGDGNDATRAALTTSRIDLDVDSDMENHTFTSTRATVSTEYDGADDMYVSTVRDPKGESLETFSISEPSWDDSRVLKEEAATSSVSSNSKSQVKSRTKKKKAVAKRTGEKVKVRKLNIPGSAKRLKLKEKAVLSNVFSKYGPKPELSVAET